MTYGPCTIPDAGKSTLARFLTNRLLTHRDHDDDAGAGGGAAAPPLAASVAFLDLDPGQPEHSPPGTLSLSVVRRPLLSPPYARAPGASRVSESERYVSRAGSDAQGSSTPIAVDPADVVAVRFIGASSIKDDPQLAVDACSDLLRLYRETLAPLGVPLVVNTHGWVRGVGFMVTQAALQAVAPTHFISLVADLGFPDRAGGRGGGAARGGGDLALRAPSSRAPGSLEILTAPATAYVPPPSSVSGSGAAPPPESSYVPSLSYTLPAWHLMPTTGDSCGIGDPGPVGGVSTTATADDDGDDGAATPAAPATMVDEGDEEESRATPGAAGVAAAVSPQPQGSGLPPRATRSPAEQRALRIMHYLLCGLRPAVEVEGGAGTSAASVGDTLPEGDFEGSSDESDDDLPAASEEPLLQDDGMGGDPHRVGAGVSAADSGAPAASGLQDTSRANDPADAFDLHVRTVSAAVTSAYARVASECPEARHPTAGLRSPAFAIEAAAVVVVPLCRGAGGGVRLCSSASSMVQLPLQQLGQSGGSSGTEPGSMGAAADALAVDGTLVGLCSARLYAYQAAAAARHASDSGAAAAYPAAPAAVAAGRLPCLGLALVRSVLGGGSRGAALVLVTPVPAPLLAALLDTVVAWGGAGSTGSPSDVPAQLLFRDSPAGDAWAVPPRTVAPTSAATARGDAPNRRFLKRKRG